MKRLILVFAILLLFSTCSAAHEGPSFDCTKAKRPDEKLICKSQELSSQDLRLQQIYSKVIGLSKDETYKNKIRKSQRSWLKHRANCKEWYLNNIGLDNTIQPEECIKKIYIFRIRHLEEYVENINSSLLVKPTCSDEDNKYSKETAGVEANEAFDFGLKIQKAVKEKDLQALFSLVDGELSNGPRRAFIKNKEFDEIFPKDWQETVLEDVPECRPIGWRGFLLGNGEIWYGIANDKLSIFSINGAKKEISGEERKKKWDYNDRALHGNCFTTIWSSGDNYEHFHETFANTENFETFFRFIGKYIGKQVPLKEVPSPWGDGTLGLAVKIPECLKEDDDKTYEILKEIPKTYCESLAPNFPQECKEIRLVTVTGPCGGSMGCDKNTAIYTIVNEQKTKAAYMLPLINFDSENDALNFIGKLDK